MDALVTSTAATSTIKRALAELAVLGTEENGAWFDTIVEWLRVCMTLEQGFNLIKAYSLAIVRDRWEEIPLDVRARYNYSFYEFASKEAGITARTLNNYISTARAFIDSGFQPRVTIEVPVRNAAGEIVKNNGHPVMQPVEWDSAKPSFSKLTVVAPLARSGALESNPSLLSMLMDDGVTVREMQQTIYGNTEDTNYIPQIRYQLRGNLITAFRYGQEIEIAEVDVENYQQDELAREAINRMLSILGISQKEILDV